MSRRREQGYQVVILDYYQKSTQSTQQLMLTDAPSYTAMGKPALPILSTLFDYTEKLFKGGTMFGDQDVGLGDISVDATNGKMDKFRFDGFDGQRIQIFQIQSLNEVLDSTSNLIFSGIQDYPEFGLANVTFHIKNRMQQLSIPMQSRVFSGGLPADLYSVLGPSADYDADPSDPDFIPDDFVVVYPPVEPDTLYINRLEGEENLAGKEKPMLFGRCLNVALVLVNSSQSIYACNYDVNGNRKAVYRFLRVYDQGSDILVDSDVANSTALFAAAPAGGYCTTCVAEGLVKFGTDPLGDATADVDEVPLSEASAPKVASRILSHVLGYQQGSDFNQAGLDALHILNPCPVGVFVTTETVINTLTLILSSIGAWMVPDHLNIFQFGRMDLPSSEPSVVTFTNDNIKKGNLDRIMTGDQGRGIPAQAVIVRHSKCWSVLNKSQTLESLPDYIRTFMSNEYRSARAANPSVLVAHPTAVTMSFDTVLVRGQRALIRNPDFSFAFGEITSPKADWTDTSAGTSTAVIANGVLTLTPAALAIASVTQLLNLKGQVTEGTWQFGFSNLGAANSLMRISDGSGALAVVSFGAADSPTPDKFGTFVYDGLSQITVKFANSFTSGSPADVAIIDNAYIQEILPGLSPSQEAARRLALMSADTESFQFAVTIQDSKNVRIGQVLTLKVDDRFGLQLGRKFRLTEKDFNTDKNQVMMTVIG